MDTEIVPNSLRRNGEEEKIEMKESYSSWKIWKKRRYVIAILAFFGFFNAFSLRTTLSIAIVAMTGNKSITSENGNITYYEQEFMWDSKLQGLLLGSFYYGYITTQFLGGWLSARIGGKRVFGVGIGVTAILTILTPVAAKESFYWLLAVRILEGIFEGVTYPSMLAIWAKWAPPLERSRLSSFTVSGCCFGAVVCMALSGYLCDTVGWESVFYVFGVFGVIWCGFWWFFVADSPSQDSKITKAEMDYIEESLGDTNNNAGPIKHPYKSILTSSAVWAVVILNFSDSWIFYTYLTQLPKFLKDISHFDLDKTGLLSGLPYLVLTITSLSVGYFLDWFSKKAILTRTQTRKLSSCSVLVLQIILMLAGAYLASPLWTTLCITLAVGINSFVWVGFATNYLELAPPHASILMAMGNSFGTVAGMLSPLVAGYVVTTPSESEWHIIFWIASGIHFVACIVFAVFGSAEQQSWCIESSPTIEPDNENSHNGAYVNTSFKAN